jgi:2-dehydropantoate 2-reductase
MRIGILGAGAIGGFFGGRLLQAGRDVTFIVRPARAQALSRDGLTIASPGGEVTLPGPPSRPAGAAGEPFDLILLACKAYDLESAIDSIAPSVDTRTAILPLLNGMRHLDVLRARFGDDAVLGGACMIAATLRPDGAIVQLTELAALTFGELDGNESERIDRIEQDLSGAGFDASASPAILPAMWEKWVFLATTAGITCLMRGTIGEIVAAGGSATTLALLEECAAIAAAAGYPVSETSMRELRTLVTTPQSRMGASMFRDLQQGLRVENDHVVGDLLRRAAKPEQCRTLATVAAHLRVYEGSLRLGDA